MSLLIAALALKPAKTIFQVKFPIRIGEDLFIVVPSPSWPLEFSPHAHKVPSFLIARLALPQSTYDHKFDPICIGEDLFIVVPFPN